MGNENKKIGGPAEERKLHTLPEKQTALRYDVSSAKSRFGLPKKKKGVLVKTETKRRVRIRG